MSRQTTQTRRRVRKGVCQARSRFRPTIEVIEDRCLLSAPAWPAWLPIASPTLSQSATLDAAQTLNLTGDPGHLSDLQAADAQGIIANQHGAGGVNWFTFTLNQVSQVQLATFNVAGASNLDSVISLYDTEAQDYTNPPINYNYDAAPYDPLQHRLMVQIDSESSGSIDRQLAAGTYYVAVSGHGDRFFNPFLADSGYAGSTGAYGLLVTASPLSIAPTDGPVVLAVDSGLSNGPGLFPGTSIVYSSPLAIYVDLSSPIDPSSVSLQQSLDDGSSVQLTYNPTGQFGNGNDSAVLLNGFHYALDAMELQLQPAAPLEPGFYQLTLAGNSSTGNQVLMDPTDTYDLGQSSANPTGQDFTTTFQVAGSEGGDDTAATAQNLGNITNGGIVQAIGAIGDDPAYSPYSSSLNLTNPAAQVNLYHFQITGQGNHEFSAEVFAGRIGSTLGAAISLFRLDASNAESPLQLIASNDGSGNQTVSSTGQYLPLATDPILDVGLTAGDYYLAVSSSGNMPDLNGNPPGSNGIFDPNMTESGTNGISTGPYVLNLLVQPAAPSPHIVATSIHAGARLTAAPTQVTLTFDSTVNLLALANQADSGSATSEPTFSSVFVVEPNGQKVFPGFLSYDTTTNQATFLMLDRLPNGVNELHLSGANGLTGLGGNPLAGNDPDGDYVVSFTVADPSAPANPLNRPEGSSHDLGVLFPTEVQNGVTIAGNLVASAFSDSYTLQLTESQEYQFSLNGPPLIPGGPPTSLPEDMQITMTDANGLPVIPLANGISNVLLANLTPGTYTIHISRSAGDTTGTVPYELLVTMLNTHDNPPPLAIGAAPALQIRALSDTPPTGTVPPSAPVVSAPSSPNTSSGVAGAALASRADLAGGVTNTTTGPSFALAAPLQVQGLSNGPIVVAFDATRAVGSDTIFAVLMSSTSTIEVATGDASATTDRLASAWSDWQWIDSLLRAAAPTNSAPRPDAEQTIAAQHGPRLARPIRMFQVEPAAELRGVPEVTETATSAVAVQVEGTTSLSAGNDESSPGMNETKRSPLTLVAAIFSTAMAALFVWGRSHRAAEPISSLKSRKTHVLDQTVKLAN